MPKKTDQYRKQLIERFAALRSSVGRISYSKRHLGGGAEGHAVAQLFEAVRFKPKGRGFDSPWCHWNFSLT